MAVEDDDRDDIEEDDITTVASSVEKNRLKDFTFADPAGQEQALVLEKLSKFTSVEHLRDYLETELGEEKIMRAYPILKDYVSVYLNFMSI